MKKKKEFTAFSAIKKAFDCTNHELLIIKLDRHECFDIV